MKKSLSFISVFIILITTTVTTSYSNNINKLNKELHDIKNKKNEIKEELSTITGEKKTVSKQVEQLDKELDKVQTEVDKLKNQLDITKNQLIQSEAELTDATKTKDNQYESLKQRVRFMYEYGNSGYFEFLLGTTKITDFFKRIEYINSIMDYDQKLFERYKEIEALIEQKVNDIKTQKENIEALNKEAEEKQKELSKSLSQKESLIKELRNKEETYLQQIADLEKEDKEIKALIQKAQRNSISKTGPSSNKVYSTGGGQLEYPVPAYRGYAYNDTYGSRTNPISKKSEFHTGLDLKATLGTDVIAAESGTVIYAGNKGGYGKTVIIDHGNNMTTLYAHNSSLSVSVGQTVSRGQVVAKAGTTGYSTGVHSHFEVRINGSHVNPAPYIQN